MRTQVVTGSKQQIADTVINLPGRILEAILLVDELAGSQRRLSDDQFEQLMAEMEANTVSVGNVDYSREAIYTRQDDE